MMSGIEKKKHVRYDSGISGYWYFYMMRRAYTRLMMMMIYSQASVAELSH